MASARDWPSTSRPVSAFKIRPRRTPMRHVSLARLAMLSLTVCLAGPRADDVGKSRQPSSSCTGEACTDEDSTDVACTDVAACEGCVPTCSSSWGEKRTRKTAYSLQCEPVGHRAAECFCTGPVECRHRPPDGDAFQKKRLYKVAGEEQVVKVPKYTVTMLPQRSCACGHGSGVCWWNPLEILHSLIRPSVAPIMPDCPPWRNRPAPETGRLHEGQ